METQNGSPTDSLTDISFYQLIETFAKKYHFDVTSYEQKLMEESVFLFSSNSSIGFPTKDIEKITFVNDDVIHNVEILVNFLGLQGASGPLPGAILNDIAYETYNQNDLKATYLNFFNHHLIVLLYTIWRKYKYYIQFKSDLSDKFSKDILSLVGITSYHLNEIPINWKKLLHFIGFIHSNSRTPEMLSKIIGYYFDLDEISISEYERQVISLEDEQRNQLGKKNMILGDDFLLGDVITVFSNKFLIHINELDISDFYKFLPSGGKFIELKCILNFLLKDQLSYDISLGLKPYSDSNFVLGDSDASFLGWSTLLNNSSEEYNEIKEIRITGQA